MHRAHLKLLDWFRELRGPLRRFLSLRRGLSHADIDDVAQEVFMRLLRYDKGEIVNNPEAYVFKIASNVASEWSQLARNRFAHDSAWLDDLPGEQAPEVELERASEHEHLLSILTTLPPRAKQILHLYFGEGLRHDEIAIRLSLTARVVKRDLINSYASLREALGGAETPQRALKTGKSAALRGARD